MKEKMKVFCMATKPEYGRTPFQMLEDEVNKFLADHNGFIGDKTVLSDGHGGLIVTVFYTEVQK
jgi:hypothetical protein